MCPTRGLFLLYLALIGKDLAKSLPCRYSRLKAINISTGFVRTQTSRFVPVPILMH